MTCLVAKNKAMVVSKVQGVIYSVLTKYWRYVSEKRENGGEEGNKCGEVDGGAKREVGWTDE